MTVSNATQAISEVFRQPAYIAISLLTALLMVSINIIAVNYTIYFSFQNFPLMKEIFIGTFSTLPTHSVVLLSALSLLSGTFVSLLIYHAKTVGVLASSATGTSGTLLGILAPSCTTCGIGLAATLGFSGMVGSLPFGGIEIGIIGLSLLIIATYVLADRIANKTCPLGTMEEATKRRKK